VLVSAASTLLTEVLGFALSCRQILGWLLKVGRDHFSIWLPDLHLLMNIIVLAAIQNVQLPPASK